MGTNLAEDSFRKLMELTAHLRGPQGCPWDRAQNYDSLRALLHFAGLEEELGDLLFLVAFYSRIAEEEGRFNIDDVAEQVRTKLIRRHPHVFGDVQARDSGEALQSWRAVKEQERAGKGKPSKSSVMDGILASLPSALVAHEIGKRAAGVGFDWVKVDDLLDKIEEEIGELRQELAARSANAGSDTGAASDASNSGSPARIEEEVGDLMFAVANLSRFLKFDPETCLRRANQKFERRFRSMEQEVSKRGKKLQDCSLEEMESIWNEIKASEAH
jgi:MazG family protein